MDEATRAIQSDIAETREELGGAVQELSERLAPRQQAQRLVAERREAARERLGSVSTEDVKAAAERARAAIVAQPQVAAAAAGVVLLLVRRRARRR